MRASTGPSPKGPVFILVDTLRKECAHYLCNWGMGKRDWEPFFIGTLLYSR